MLFAIPGLVMIVAYGLISRELYRGIHFEMGHKKDSTGEATQPHIHKITKSLHHVLKHTEMLTEDPNL